MNQVPRGIESVQHGFKRNEVRLERTVHSPDVIREKAEAWFARQVETLSSCHGIDWPKHQAWIEAYLKEELRQRLIALGWRPKV